jgi:hypothetical protein
VQARSGTAQLGSVWSGTTKPSASNLAYGPGSGAVPVLVTLPGGDPGPVVIRAELAPGATVRVQPFAYLTS